MEAGLGVILLFIIDRNLSKLWERSEKRRGFYFSSLVSLERSLASRGASLLIREIYIKYYENFYEQEQGHLDNLDTIEEG